MARAGWLSGLILLATLLVPGVVRAQAYADEGMAYSACWSYISNYVKTRPEVTRSPRCPHRVQGATGVFEGQNENIGFDGATWTLSPKHGLFPYPIEKKCSSRKDYNGPYPNGQYKPKSGSLSCDLGCEVIWTHNADGTVNGQPMGGVCSGEDYDSDDDCEKAAAGGGYYYNRQVGVCEPPEPECKGGEKANSVGQCEPEPCPSGMTQNADGTCKKKNNECPAGQVKSPDGRCLPGEGQCAAGEVRGPDGTCKKDGDGDGEPDEPGEGDKEFFAGGDDCNSPPSCSGSPILCGQARIQWRIECNTRRNRNIAGGTCAAMPVCTGEKCDAMEYSSLLMQWRTACATEKLLAKDSGNGGDGGQPEWTKVAGMSTDLGLGSSPDDTKVLTVKKIGVDQLDQSGFGGGGGCIGFAVGGGNGIGSGFAQAMASPPAFFCNYILLIRGVLILSASVTCAYILASGGKN